MTNYTAACAVIRASAQDAQTDDEQIRKAVADYRTHLFSHRELKNYVGDVSIIWPALRTWVTNTLLPVYASTATRAKDTDPVDPAEPAMDLVECLVYLCADFAENDERAVSKECQQRRDQVGSEVDANEIAILVEAVIRHGISASYAKTRARLVAACMTLARFIGSVDNESWLKVLRLGIDCVEAPETRSRAVAALGVISRDKLALGRRTTAVKVSHELTLCVSSLIDIYHEEPNPPEDELLTNSRFTLSVIFRLLSDPERAEADSVSWTTFLSQLLDSRFTSDKDDDMYSGLCFLNEVYTSATSEFVSYVASSCLVLRVLPLILKTEHRPLRLRIVALTFLNYCMDYPVLRDTLLSADAIDLLSPMVTTDIPIDDAELQASVLAVLAKLSLHGPSTKDLLYDTIPFHENLKKLITLVRSKKTDDQESKRIANNLLCVLSALSFNADFKAHALGLSLQRVREVEAMYAGDEGGDGGTKEHPLVKPGSQLDSLITDLIIEGRSDTTEASLDHLVYLSETADLEVARFHIVVTIYNLVRAKQDTRVLRKGRNGPDFDDDQLKQLEVMYEKLPAEAKPKDRLVYDAGGLLVTFAVRRRVLEDKTLVPLLIKLSQAKSAKGNLLPSLVMLGAQTVRYLSSYLAYRPVLINQGGLKVLLEALQLDTTDTYTRFALVSLVATSRPESFSYQTRMSCAHQALTAIDTASEELHVHFAARALVNLSAPFEDVAVKIFDGGSGWRRLESVLTDWSESTSTFAAEIMCNISAKEPVCLSIAELVEAKKMPWTLALLLAYAGDASVASRQLACLGALSYLTQAQVIAAHFADPACTVKFNDKEIRVSDKLIELWFEICGSGDSEGAQLRLAAALLSIFSYGIESADKAVTPDDMRLKFILAVGIVWNQISATCRSFIKTTLGSVEWTPPGRELLGQLTARAPTPEIAHLWDSLLSK